MHFYARLFQNASTLAGVRQELAVQLVKQRFTSVVALLHLFSRLPIDTIENLE
jgi:hypothetical protein